MERDQVIVRFNPLTGISSILTLLFVGGSRLFQKCFNPLTGISSILTDGLQCRRRSDEFVSIP